MQSTSVTCKIGNKEFIFESGLLAKQAAGAVLARLGGTSILSASVMDHKTSDADFFPLTVNYSEKYYAAGKIPGGFFKREGKPREKEILVSRLIDRPIRPLFPDGFRNEVQIVPTALSVDSINPQDIPAINCASCSLVISDIPFDGPIGAVRIGYINNAFVINPEYKEIEQSSLDLVIAGTKDAIMMVEGCCSMVSEEILLEGMKEAHKAIAVLVNAQLELAQKIGKPKKKITLFTIDPELEKKVRAISSVRIEKESFNPDKLNRQETLDSILAEAEEKFSDLDEKLKPQIKMVIEKIEKEVIRRGILADNKRPDGRAVDQIRQLDCRIDILPQVHGSALFTRGQTQALAVATLGSPHDEQMMDDLEGNSYKKFMLHYNFPPFSVGECGRMGGPGRREIGHGHLAERAIARVLPSHNDFKYSIRLVSEILESNGSSSMASVCAGAMSLLAAGVPLKAPVAGIAMGLVTDGKNFRVLTDIQGAEDHYGDMDFKVAGTRDGITAFQLDIKVEGLTFAIIEQALAQAKKARMEILDKMQTAIPQARKELAPSAPRFEKITIKKDYIKNLIGPGGKNIKSITEATGSDINIEDDGTVYIYSKDQDTLKRTLAEVNKFTHFPEPGEIYEGTVRKIMDFGAFIEILPGVDGLCHISEFAETRIRSVSDVTKLGAKLTVKVIGIDDQNRVNLSHKQVISHS
ncbi:MAG TPA: polyribonucleotide nucleotidyltransferase [Spirochaetia bacterium]|nr:polyribonucleotide nucleotidyltransferase [Spirochaetia bacterium]